MSALTIETLEHMFVYLGCANVPTQNDMDGAIPLESMIGLGRDVAAVFEPSQLESLGTDWCTKAVWFSGESLGLSTVRNVHWSDIANGLDYHMPSLRIRDPFIKRRAASESDGFARIYYSEIDRFGRFVKFPVKKKYTSNLAMKASFNPGWTLEFAKGQMSVFSSDSDDVYESRRLSFLAPFLCGLTQSLGTYWLVKTRFESICPSLTLLTDPTGVKEFWKLRDIPEGKRRRSALMHWVEMHWRQSRNDPDVEVFVRKHLRGQASLTQGRFQAEIVPSKQDYSANVSLRTEREAMRKAKTDRRRTLVRRCGSRKSRFGLAW